MEFSIEILPSERNMFARLQMALERIEIAKTCRFLVPASKNVRMIHCNMGDGVEGICHIYEGETDKCRFKEDKMALKSKEVKYYEVDYEDLDVFINELFFGGKKTFEFIPDEESDNDVSHTFNVDGSVGEHAQKRIAEGDTMYMTRTYLDEACRLGKIPAGEYLVKVNW